jgi:hypothetical protein
VSCLAEQSEAPIGRLNREWHSYSGRRDPAYRNIPSARCRMWGRVPMGRTAIMRPNLANSTGPMRGTQCHLTGYMTRHVKEDGGRRGHPHHGRYREWDY